MRGKRLIAVGLMSLALLTACNNGSKSAAVEKPKVEVEDTAFLDEMETKTNFIEFKKSEFTPSVTKYEIKSDLSNIENISKFGNFTENQKNKLVENAFVITKPKNSDNYYLPEGEWEYEYDQIHQIYEENVYTEIANFITTDSMTHIFHIFYDGFLRNLETNELYPKSIDFNKKLLEGNINIYNNLTDEKLKEAQLKNIAMIATDLHLLGEEYSIPEEAKELVNSEIASAESQEVGHSVIADKEVDFSQLTPRGHYTRSEELEKYFKGTMYYGQIGLFPLENGVNEEKILQGLLLTHSIYKNPELLKTWEDIVEPIDFLVENADDLSIREYARFLYGVYGKEFDVNELNDSKKIKAVAALIEELPNPQIAGFMGKSFRLMPQRAVIDNVLMQNVVDIAADNKPSERPIYSGLDLMTALGSIKAREITKEDPYNSHWKDYPKRTEENIKTVENFSEKDWQKNLYRGWLWMLQSYTQDFGEGYPMFMQNDAWKRKDLVSALGSYAELKHDTVLYGKAVMAEMGGGGEIEIPKSYVEPNVELYNKLSWLLEFTKVNLKDREMLSTEYENKLDNFKELVDFLATISVKELENSKITEEEFTRLYTIGGEMEALMVDFVESDSEFEVSNWFEIQNATDRRMPVVVDLMRVVENTTGIPAGKLSHIGTGRPMEIYAVYPHEGKLYMGKGATFSYFEFLNDERLTDEKWQEMVYNEKTDYPTWYKDLITEEKEKLEFSYEY
ncbi:DUF3160 domain-containing protein [Peptoniphilus sp. MSJ-1]|uniref:DUF3160 domain-containing protein n=1 Tax=Peptoniphilus ovalis TaxID=2841503 RepID=A0ABS6FJ24_9FIRM|nr:DUF3160 domain-containing protein [Peptoniphilus ovalis]MBU5670175.1 DUF3160 domain-containing protein [Peptoniphilus ovalis]